MTPRLLLGLTVVGLVGAGCQKKQEPAAGGSGSSGATATAVPATKAEEAAAAPRDARNTNYEAGAGVVQNVRKAAKRTVTVNDLHQLGVFVQQMYTENGKMPGPAEIKDYIRRDAPKVVAAIDDGSIILTGTKNHEGLWAYEVDAENVGGVALVGGTAKRAEAAEVKQLLAQK